jgi:hypothetical protein
MQKSPSEDAKILLEYIKYHLITFSENQRSEN